ncbi:MAG TPA: 4Fe-4S dicluster domain-containing protein [Candidatus Lokiarchaeia archaeon]|nr:4Fe-4S dicluster domain-containing protein [Candidatus Lokiarchaeia archaeon]
MEKIDSVYRTLQQEIDTRMPVGFPESKEGHDIEILKLLFTEEEASIAIHLSALPETVNRIHKRVQKAGIDISIDTLCKMLDGLVNKGAISGGNGRYSLAQFAVGMFEYQAGRISKEFAEQSIAYVDEVFHKELIKKGVPVQLRVIPIGESITPERVVGTYDDVRAMIEGMPGPIATIPCVCRESRDITGTPCTVSDMRRVCTIFGSTAKALTNQGLATEVSKQEILGMLDEYRKAGFVLQPENNLDPSFMCVCCGCCCGVLTAAKQFPKPAELYHSNYIANSTAETCSGCGVCAKRCQMDAITIDEKKARVNPDRCIGCGNCVPTCKPGAIHLDARSSVVAPEKNQMAFYRKIIMKKRGPAKALVQLIGTTLLGKKF